MGATPSTVETSEIYFNPWDENFRANPYPHYKALLSGPPHILKHFFDAALVTRYDDVKTVLLDHANFSSVQQNTPGFEDQVNLFDEAPTVLFSDPPIHTRLRKLVSRDFTPRRVRELEPRIREIMRELLDAAASKGHLDVMADVANVLPVKVISEMLGVPADEYVIFKEWSDRIVESDNILPGTPMPPEIKSAVQELKSYFTAQIERRRANPGSDLVSALVAHEQNEALSAQELLQFVILLLLAGNETTTNLIGNGMLALGRHPNQMAALRANPELMPRAIEEMLRYDGPVQATGRTALRDTVVGGVELKAGTMAFVILAAANRDPAHFADPDKFDITRDANGHVAFGEGIHFCLGSGLARLEGAIAFGDMLSRFPKLRLANPDAPLTYKGSYFLRGLSHLEMAID